MAAACTCPLSLQDPMVSHLSILGFGGVLARAPFAADMCPQCALLLSPHWCKLHSRYLPDSQSGIPSRKCGLVGRPRVFRVPFGTGPLASDKLIHFVSQHKAQFEGKAPVVHDLTSYHDRTTDSSGHQDIILPFMHFSLSS
ncbi:hypothetical protein DPX16_15494 [Anabarilius grahami]|uniref:Uncharacterized protein n=1 Tax=Anabarilius grahami TaxID=495550 RepID=A0A3N0XCI4_ANAGA|nr:hypothetical protein DPX16_15494 [Anabarilius grahami]